VLHKLLRTDDAGVRARVLRHYLAPRTELVTPTADVIPLDKPLPALVSPDDFAAAVGRAVDRAATWAGNEDVKVGVVEDVRNCAKDARAVLAEAHGEGSAVVGEFGAALAPAFARWRRPEAAP